MTDPRVAQALRLWGLTGARFTLAAQRENQVYRVQHGSCTFALRLHRPGYRSRDALISELNWCAYLADQGMLVPCPVKDNNGALLHQVGDTFVSVLEWLDGIPIGEGTNFHGTPTDLAFRAGQEMARLHDETDRWNPPATFIRPDWTLDALIGETPLWGRFWEHPDLGPRDVDMLHAARAHAREQIGLIAQDSGLIHADILAENLLLQGDRIGLLDFDDGAIGYRAFELATFLLRYLERPDFGDISAALVAGYDQRQHITNDALTLALMLRALTYVGWIIPRLGEPGGVDRSHRMIARALKLSQNCLEGRPL